MPLDGLRQPLLGWPRRRRRRLGLLWEELTEQLEARGAGEAVGALGALAARLQRPIQLREGARLGVLHKDRVDRAPQPDFNREPPLGQQLRLGVDLMQRAERVAARRRGGAQLGRREGYRRRQLRTDGDEGRVRGPRACHCEANRPRPLPRLRALAALARQRNLGVALDRDVEYRRVRASCRFGGHGWGASLRRWRSARGEKNSVRLVFSIPPFSFFLSCFLSGATM